MPDNRTGATVRLGGLLVYLWRALGVLFVIALPVLFICSSVTYAFNEMRLYSYGFDKYDISTRTGITDGGLRDSARTIRGYFNSPSSPLVLKAEVHGEERELFTERELLHMADVKRLLWGVYGLGTGAMAYLLGYAVVGLWRNGRCYGIRLAGLGLRGGGTTVAFVLGVGLISLVGFDSLFLLFHKISFANDFWRLNPREHFLVMMFPQGFWLDATLFVGILALAQSVILAAVCVCVLRRQKLQGLWHAMKGKLRQTVAGRLS